MPVWPTSPYGAMSSLVQVSTDFPEQSLDVQQMCKISGRIQVPDKEYLCLLQDASRKVRPDKLTLWRKSMALAAKLLCTTCVTSGMSMPRAAASVHTNTPPSLRPQALRDSKDTKHTREMCIYLQVTWIAIMGNQGNPLQWKGSLISENYTMTACMQCDR
jgi:hypothetical protein